LEGVKVRGPFRKQRAGKHKEGRVSLICGPNQGVVASPLKYISHLSLLGKACLPTTHEPQVCSGLDPQPCRAACMEQVLVNIHQQHMGSGKAEAMGWKGLG
jgi:hypothetical protein